MAPLALMSATEDSAELIEAALPIVRRKAGQIARRYRRLAQSLRINQDDFESTAMAALVEWAQRQLGRVNVESLVEVRCRDLLRRSRPRDNPTLRIHTIDVADVASTPRDAVREVDAGDSFASLISGLDPRDQQLLRLRFELDYSQQEIADRIGVSIATVHRHLRAVQAQIRNTLARAS